MSRITTGIALAVFTMLLITSAPVSAAVAPKNLRVVDLWSTSVTVAWDASTGTSRTLYYEVNEWCVEPAQYTFVVQANDSAHSQPLTVTIPVPGH